MKRRAAVFLDRDGVIIEDGGYVADAEQVRLLPGAAQAIAALNRAGWHVVVVTNQSGIARGYFSPTALEEVHDRLKQLLWCYGASLDAIYVCPHHPDGVIDDYREACHCRKPQPGLLLQAAADLQLDLSQCWLIGDRPSDLEAGAQAGCRTVLVRTGFGKHVDTVALDRTRLRLELVATDLADAVCKLGLDRQHRCAA
ncbi:MAG: D-glycero-beta-D-manno-heptose 1,7-bisphosphate 7-phosphatase [Gemmataceae bacterium]|nr:D-glycero-beta-D-manno-heptose 1,7-bisphosphate 7-phosphatase [Gemmataceae bacterium]